MASLQLGHCLQALQALSHRHSARVQHMSPGERVRAAGLVLREAERLLRLAAKSACKGTTTTRRAAAAALLGEQLREQPDFPLPCFESPADALEDLRTQQLSYGGAARHARHARF